MSNRSEHNQPIIAEFHANAGKVGGQLTDTPLLLQLVLHVNAG
jgi:hypothetical protein